MRVLLYLLIFLSHLSLHSQDISFIPQPQNVTYNSGSYTFSSNYVIETKSEDLFKNEIEYLKHKIKPSTSFFRKPSKIHFIYTDYVETDESYYLSIKKDGIHIQAKNPKGAFYAIQTLLQMLPEEIYQQSELAKVSLPNIDVWDSPHFPWRGLLLDCSRHFMEKEFVLKYIDLLAYHKMNTLHWHITEDQGWRIEIDAYPKLTEIGAWREDVYNEADGDLYGGFYTKEDIKEIVSYAKTRHINVVPEIEMPGHSQAALAAYPEFSCTGGPFKVETEWGVFKEIYCAGNPATTEFLKNILDEVLDMFPSEYIHVGADEVPKYRWEHCDKCQKRMVENDLEDEEELQSHFLSDINNYLKSKGRTMTGWDEIAEGGHPEDIIVQSWRGYKGAEEAIEAGLRTIVSPTSHAYFDYDLKSIDLEKVYNFDPYPENIDRSKKSLVLGGECNMWSERAPQHKVDSKVFPRLLAMTEVLWSYPGERNYKEFYARVQNHYNRLNAMEVAYGFETIPIELKSYRNSNGESMLELLPSIPNIEIQYIYDSYEKIKYTEPILLSRDAEFQAYALRDELPYGEPIKRTFEQHMGIGKIYTLEKEYSSHYTGGDYNALSNGWKGSTDFRDGQWQGYYGDDLIAEYDFSDSPVILEKVAAGFMQYNNSWIFMPSYLEVEVSENGQDYISLGKTITSIDPKERGRHLENLEVNFDSQEIKYLRVTAKNFGKCPDWHEAAGSKAWLFIDEIILE